MATDLLIAAIKSVIMILLALNLALFLLYFERKGSALIHDRIGANRASVFGIGKRLGLPNLGIVNTALADPIKLFTKEDFVPDGADKFLHAFAPFIALFPVLVTFAAIPFGDTLRIGDRAINLQAAPLNVGVPAAHPGLSWSSDHAIARSRVVGSMASDGKLLTRNCSKLRRARPCATFVG